MNECPFCLIVARRAPATIVADWPGSGLAIVPLRPRAPGHLLVIPEDHIASAAEDPEMAGATAILAARIGRALYRSFNLITSVGASATQTVFHLHWHVLPRVPDDGLLLPWSDQ